MSVSNFTNRHEKKEFKPCVYWLHPGDTIDVSIIKGRKDLIGKYYSQPGVDGAPLYEYHGQGVTCLSRQNIDIKHKDVWRAEVIKVCERCLIVKYLAKKGTWGAIFGEQENNNS